MRSTIFYFFLFAFIFVNAQNRINIEGYLKSKNSEITQIHIFNLQSKKGTISDNNGIFNIKVSKRDTLLISSIQFSTLKYVVTETDLISKKIIIFLKSEATNLEQVVVNSHNLSGSLLLDIKKVPKNFQQHASYKLDLKDINFKAPGLIENPIDKKLPDPLRTSETVNSINLIPIFKMLTSGIRKKIRLKKKYKMRIAKLPKESRINLGDLFFVDNLKISKPLIDDFLIYCQKKGILRLDFKKNKMELIENLFRESKNYLETIKP
ncbi:MAG TPA: hypothetical protein ENK67_03305 [Flavobacteriia bacterium]|nr:hypothetical protein [Flavobacteriia bacterium]